MYPPGFAVYITLELMQYIASLLVLVYALLASSSAFAECLYCDEWRAFSGEPYFLDSIAVITETSIKLPSCSKSAYDIVRSAPSKMFGAVCTEHYLRLRDTPTCARIQTQLLKPIVMVVACPRTPQGNQELNLSLLQDSTVPDEFQPQFFGAWWRLIRNAYDPGDSGGGHGQWMCTHFKLERAEQELDALSRKESQVARKRWLANRDRKCKQKGDGFSESWAYRAEDNCKLTLTNEKIAVAKRREKRP